MKKTKNNQPVQTSQIMEFVSAELVVVVVVAVAVIVILVDELMILLEND